MDFQRRTFWLQSARIRRSADRYRAGRAWYGPRATMCLVDLLRLDRALQEHVFELCFKPFVALGAFSNGLDWASDDVLVFVLIDLKSFSQRNLNTLDQTAAIGQTHLRELMVAIWFEMGRHFQCLIQQIEGSNRLGQCRGPICAQRPKLRNVLSDFNQGRLRPIRTGAFQSKNARRSVKSSYSDVVVHDLDCLQPSDQGFGFGPAQGGEYGLVDIIFLKAPSALAQAQPHSGAGRCRSSDSRGPVCRRGVGDEPAKCGREYRSDPQYDGDGAECQYPTAPIEPVANRFVHRGSIPLCGIAGSYSSIWGNVSRSSPMTPWPTACGNHILLDVGRVAR